MVVAGSATCLVAPPATSDSTVKNPYTNLMRETCIQKTPRCADPEPENAGAHTIIQIFIYRKDQLSLLLNLSQLRRCLYESLFWKRQNSMC